MNVAVKPEFSWPNRTIEFTFEGKRIVSQPVNDDLCATVSLYDEHGLPFDEGASLLCRFLSRLAWSKNAGIHDLFFAGSGNPDHPGRLGTVGQYGRSIWMPVEPWDFLYLPQTLDVEAGLALALYREGMTLNSAPHAFLSYYKVLNIKDRFGSNKQEAWINDNINELRYTPAEDRLRELRMFETNIGKYMYNQGRCAVAHADVRRKRKPVNPDDYGDKRRLGDDLRLMKELSARFIESEFGILTDSSFYKHLRELEVWPRDWLRRTETLDGRVCYISAEDSRYSYLRSSIQSN